MLKTESMELVAPAIGERILRFVKNSTLNPYVVVENRDESSSASIEYQDSDDGTTWTTVVGTSQSISPLQADGQIVSSSKSYLALFAQGNVQLVIYLVRQYNTPVQPLF